MAKERWSKRLSESNEAEVQRRLAARAFDPTCPICMADAAHEADMAVHEATPIYEHGLSKRLRAMGEALSNIRHRSKGLCLAHAKERQRVD